jgi:hypothetical protein
LHCGSFAGGGQVAIPVSTGLPTVGDSCRDNAGLQYPLLFQKRSRDATVISLIVRIFSLLQVLKFPVSSPRQFACKPLKLAVDQASKTGRKTGFRKFPCLFPC